MEGGSVLVGGEQVHSLAPGPLELSDEREGAVRWPRLVWQASPAEQRPQRVHSRSLHTPPHKHFLEGRACVIFLQCIWVAV